MKGAVRHWFIYFIALGLACHASADEVPLSFTYQGRLFNNSGTLPLLSTVDLKFDILSPNGACLLYSERQNGINLNTSNGVFAVTIGSSVGDAKRTASGSDFGLSMPTIFANKGLEIRPDDSGTTNTCPGGYTPLANDVRTMRMTVIDGGTTTVLAPNQAIQSVPYATVAETLQGITPSGFIKVLATVTQANLSTLTAGGDASTLHHHDSLYAKLSSATNQNLGSGGLYTTGAIGVGTSTPATQIEIEAANPALRIDATSGTSQIQFYSGATERARIQSSATTDQLQFYTGSTLALTLDQNRNAFFTGNLTSAGFISMGQYTNANELTLVTTYLNACGTSCRGTMWTNSDLSALRYWNGSGVDTIPSFTTFTAGGVPYSTASGLAITAAGTAGEVLTSNGAGAPTWAAVNDASKLPLAGGTMTGPINMGAFTISNVGTPSAADQAVNKSYVDTAISGTSGSYVLKSGDTMTGALTLPANGLVAGTNQLVLSGSNVGIGTTNPTEDLSIFSSAFAGISVKGAGDATEFSALILESDEATDKAWEINHSKTLLNNLTYQYYDGSSWVTKMAITPSGNVGIGTTAPNTTLDVNGAFSLRGMAAPATSVAGQGRIYYDSTANKFKISENNGSYSDLVIGNDSLSIDSLSDAIASGASPYNLLMGTGVGSSTTGTDNTAAGQRAFQSNILGSSNTAYGAYALNSNVGAGSNTAIGYGAMQYANSTAATTTTGNTAVGHSALRGSITAASNTGTNNTAVGRDSQLNATNGGSNSSLGYSALRANQSGAWNVSVGANSLQSHTSGSSNVGVGAYTMFSATGGGGNTALGDMALEYFVSGSGNVAVGSAAGGRDYAHSFSGNRNVFLGQESGGSITSGDQNILIGYRAGNLLDTGSNNIVIGASKEVLTSTTSNYLNIGDTIYGNLSSGKVGIGTTTPSEMLSVNGAISIGTTTGTGDGTIRWTGTDFEGRKAGSWVSLTSVAGGSGDITDVLPGTGLSGGGTSGAVTLSMADTAVTPNSYGSASQIPSFTVDQQGRLTAAGNISIAIPPSQITQGGANTDDVLTWSGSAWVADTIANILGYTPVNKAGDTMTGALTMGQQINMSSDGGTTKNRIINVDVPTGTSDAATKGYVDTAVSTAGGSYVLKAGDTMTGALTLPANGLVAGTNQLVLSGGNVGIGTTSPTDLLHVEKNQGAQTLITVKNTNAGSGSMAGFVAASDSISGFFLQSSSNYGSALNIGTGSTNDVNLVTNGNNSITIKSSGNVGIGTTSPGGTLVVRNPSSGTPAAGTFRVEANDGSEWFAVGSGGNPGVVAFNTQGGSTRVAGGDLGARMNIGSLSAAVVPLAISGVASQTGNLFQVDTNGTGGNQFIIKASGNVGIGVTGPTSKLQVAGDITPDTTATKNLGSGSLRWNNIYLSNAPDVSSDARLKKDVKTSDLGLDFINSLRPVSWTWKDPSQGTTQHYGVIAQETESAIAKAKGQDSNNVIVTHNEETDSYSVRYTELISPLIKAIQELYNDLLGIKAVNDTQSRQIASKADQEALNAANAKIQKLETENAAMKAYLCAKDPKATICK